VNSIFGKGYIGVMDSPEMCVICNALYPNMEHMVNLGALLIQHFRRQRSANLGDIRCGGLVTQIAYSRNLVMASGNVVVGIKHFDTNHMDSTKFLCVYRLNNQLRAYQFFLKLTVTCSKSHLLQELLLFLLPLVFQERNTWVLSLEEFHTLRVAAGRDLALERNAAWEQQNDQAGDDDRQWGEHGGMTTVRTTNSCSTNTSRRSSPTCSHRRDTTMTRWRSTTPWLVTSVTWGACYMM
jgi:hypothetical protein